MKDTIWRIVLGATSVPAVAAVLILLITRGGDDWSEDLIYTDYGIYRGGDRVELIVQDGRAVGYRPFVPVTPDVPEYDDCTSQGEVMRWARSNGIPKKMTMHVAAIWKYNQPVTVNRTTTLSGEYEPLRERATRLGVQTIRFD